MRNDDEYIPVLTSKDFIGRDELMDIIHRAVKASGQKLRIVNIQGEGGVGKTSVLKETGRRYDNYENPGLLVTGLIDFFDISTRTRRGFMLRLFDELKRDYQNQNLTELYQTVTDAWNDFAKVEISGAGGQLLKEKNENLKGMFRNFYRELAVHYRIVIRIDTFELVEHIFGDWLAAKFIPELNDTVVLIAGRTNEKWNPVIIDAVGDEQVDYYELKTFNEQDTEKLFNLSDLGKSVDAEEREKLWILGKGRPVLLTLALDLRDRLGITIKNLTKTTAEYSLSQLKTMPDEELKAVRDVFEAELVARFMNCQPDDNAVNLMAIIYKYFTADMMAYFLGISKEEADNTLKSIAEWTFMKFQQSGDSFQLHDLVRDLVVKHVWPKIDPTGGYRKKCYQKAVVYYEGIIADRKKEIAQCLHEVKIAEDRGEHKQQFETVNKMLALRQQKRFFEIQKTYYDLMHDYDSAVVRYRYLFVDMAWARESGFYNLIREERNNACSMLGKTYPKEYMLLEDARIQIVSEGQFDKGLEILNAAPLKEVQKEKDPIWFSLILLYRGIALNYKGDVQQSEKLIEECIEVLKKHELSLPDTPGPCNLKTLPISRTLARAYTNLGYMYLASFRFTMAIEAYKHGLVYSEYSGQESLSAAIRNDLAFAYARFGKVGVARTLCKDGLEIRERLGEAYFTGLSYNMLGRVEYFQRKYEAGVRFGEMALKIFERIGDLRGLALAHRNLGANLGALAKVRNLLEYFEKAENHLEKALSLFTEKDIQPEPNYLIEIYELFALLYQDWGATIVKHGSSKDPIEAFNEKAEKWFQQAIDLARDKKYEWAEAHLLERRFTFYFKYMKKRDSDAKEILTAIENILLKKIPIEVMPSITPARRIPIDTIGDNLEKEYVYILGRLCRGKARFAFSDYLEIKKPKLLKDAAIYYALGCAFMEWFGRWSYGMEATLNEITENFHKITHVEIADFHRKVEKALKNYGLKKYSSILEWIEDYTGLI